MERQKIQWPENSDKVKGLNYLAQHSKFAEFKSIFKEKKF